MTFRRRVLARYRVVSDFKTSQGFMRALNQKFAELMRDPKLQAQVVEESAHYSHDQGDDAILDQAFGEIYPAWMQDLERRGNFTGARLIVYRGISVAEPHDIRFDRCGVFWTWDPAKAANYSDVSTKLPLYVVGAEMSVKDVDLKATLRKIVWPGYSHQESEREFTLRPGARLKLVGLTLAGRPVDVPLPAEIRAAQKSWPTLQVGDL